MERVLSSSNANKCIYTISPCSSVNYASLSNQNDGMTFPPVVPLSESCASFSELLEGPNESYSADAGKEARARLNELTSAYQSLQPDT